MDNNWQRPQRAHWVLGATFFAAFGLLAAWLIHIPYMTVDGPDGRLTLAEKTARQQTQRLTMEPLRGPIVDARLRPLVLTTESYDIFADPQLVQEGRPERGALHAAKSDATLGPTAGLQAALFLDRGYAANRARAAEQLSPLLGLEPGEIDHLIADHPDKHFVYLKRRVDRETRDKIEGLKVWGIGSVADGKRNHPDGQLAVHVLGTTGYDNEGTDKLELSQDRRLRGESGHRNVEMDGHRRPIWISPDGFEPVKDGQVLQLTMDLAVQSFAEEAIKNAVAKYRAKGASCLVMDPQTGEVLAMANYPSFDPDDFEKAPAYAVRNRLLTDPYEPGSTFKSFISSVALEEGVVHKGEMFDCHNGVFLVNGRRLTDSHPYGMLSFEQVVIKSSNIGMGQIGIRMGNDRLYEAVKRFGFGVSTNLGLPGEGRGLVHPLNHWTKLSASSIPMGYEVLVTPLQMVTAWCALANGGTLMKPHLMKAVYGPDGRLIDDLAVPASVRRVLRQDTADYMRREVFRGVVLDGTARDAFKGCPYRVFGKTGTAKKRDPHGKGYSSDLFVGSFIGAAPLEHPRLVVFVSLDEPDRSLAYYGGTVAAPAVREILEKSLGYLHVPADVTEADAAATHLVSAHDH